MIKEAYINGLLRIEGSLKQKFVYVIFLIILYLTLDKYRAKNSCKLTIDKDWNSRTLTKNVIEIIQKTHERFSDRIILSLFWFGVCF